ncbi:MAG: hypothetical protein ACREJC_09780 [Tepidisphaeraceae bacterium]
MRRFNIASILPLMMLGLSPWPATVGAQPAQQPTMQERVGAMKKSMMQSQQALRQYEWIETTVVFMKGEEKSSTQKRCYYGVDGKVEKVPLAPPPEQEKKGGIRGKIAEKKKAELTDYMKQAVQLVHSYVPPNQELIEKAKDAGNASVEILDPGKRIALAFKDYQVSGDSLKIEMTLADNRLAGISVSTLLENKSEKDPVTLDVSMGTLDDGTTYSQETVLQAPAKELKVVITNSGYRKQ